MFGKKLIDFLHKETDTILRERNSVKTKQYIEYITRKISESKLQEHREVLIKSLSDQQRILMMSNAGNFLQLSLLVL